MKRNKHGINFDHGIPLTTDQDFQILYLDIIPGKKQRVIEWMKDDSDNPLCVAGQIGTGKTTFITKAIMEAGKEPDLTISFDTQIPFFTSGAFWSVFFGHVLSYSRDIGIDLSSFKIDEIFIEKKKHGDLGKIIDLLCSPVNSVDLYNRKKTFFSKADNYIDVIQNIAGTIIRQIEKKQARPILFFAEGIDKFSIHRADYFSLLPLLNFLSRYKTLYEANLIHIAGGGDEWQHKSNKIIVNNISNQNLSKILEKRMGVYSKAKQEILPLISELSGGNMRQGLRLLMEYDYATGKLKRNRIESINYASKRVRNDFLNIPAGKINPELLQVIHRDNYLKTGVVAGFSQGEDARNAIYSNWVLITDEPDENQNWPALINPLILPGLSSVKTIPDSPEIQLIKNWAKEHDISPFGLEIDSNGFETKHVDTEKTSMENVPQEDVPDRAGIFFNIINNLQYSYDAMNIAEIFDGMASFIVNTERKDKIIIAYKKRDLVELANDYIIGRSGCYKSLRFNEILLNTENSKNFFMTIIENIDDGQFDAYSIFFDDILNKDQILLFEKNRDQFIEHKMVWWIEDNMLKKYLSCWTQLRQFFYIFRLEQDILRSMTTKEVKQDLEILQYSQSENGAKQHIEKLKAVLNYLENKALK